MKRWFRDRELSRTNRRGAVVAMLTCPCHAVMLVFLTAGTTVGTWLAAHVGFLVAGSAVLFLTGLYFMVRPDPGACPVPGAQERRGRSVDT